MIAEKEVVKDDGGRRWLRKKGEGCIHGERWQRKIEEGD